MYAATTSVALVGGDVRPVEVQVHVGRQQEQFKLSGLADAAIREAKDRVRSAVVSSGIDFPNRTVTVNLAPAHLPKTGTDYDLPIALAVLAASRVIPDTGKAIVVGELALDGTVRSGPSTLGAAVLSARWGRACLVGAGAAGSVAAVPGSQVLGVSSLAEAVNEIRLGLTSAASEAVDVHSSGAVPADLADVQGQPIARRAVEVAAAGGHNLLMHGPPGGGKTMLARRMAGILPPLSDDEMVEVALVHAAAGLDRGLDRRPPFRSPHHTASRVALVGGGSGVATPGEVSLAHRGVLFLDEMAEFPRSSLDSLRQPLEDGLVTVARRGATTRFPASFHLIAATNPCPCGFYGDRRKPCQCRPSSVSRFRQRVSGPLLDRFDLVVEVGRLVTEDIGKSESSAVVRNRVETARSSIRRRPPSLDEVASGLLDGALDAGVITARGRDRLSRVAGTIAALAGERLVGEDHVAEAMALRGEW